MTAIEQAIEALEMALPLMEEQATIQGYGFYRPANPNDFSPDPESCTEEEIANHRAACQAYDDGKYEPDTSGGWVSPNLHILKAPWGIGSYTETIPELQAQCEKARAALTALRGVKEQPVAWGMPDAETGQIYDCISPQEHDFIEGGYTIPLYATPPRAERMSEAEIDALTSQALGALNLLYSISYMYRGLGVTWAGKHEDALAQAKQALDAARASKGAAS